MKQIKSLILLAALGSLLHFFRLATPAQVIFDEVHFGKFITAYCCTGERFFDIHPPHAKLLTAGVAWLGGYRGGFAFDHIGQDYGSIPIAALRLWPALTGIALPLIFFTLLRQMGASEQIAWLGGLTLVLDNALLVQTRIIALDGTLLVATFGAISAALAGRAPRSLGEVGWPLLAGSLAGLAVGTKFTGLTAPLIIAAIMFFKLWSGHIKLRPWLMQVILMSLAAIGLYMLGWWVHWQLLPKTGSGDAWMIPTGHFIADTVKMHQLMLSANYNLTATHHDASLAITWPLMKTPVYYWAGSGADIYFIGNPVVWWGSGILFLIAVGSAMKKIFNFQFSIFKITWIPFLGYIISYLPLLRVPRALFLYHYLTPLLFALLFGLLWLDTRKISTHYSLLTTHSIIIALALGFILLSPLTYGLALPNYQSLLFRFIPGWR